MLKPLLSGFSISMFTNTQMTMAGVRLVRQPHLVLSVRKSVCAVT